MEVDLFRIKNDRYGRYDQNYNQTFFIENKRDFSDKRKKVYVFYVNNQDTYSLIVLTEKDLLELNTRIKLDKPMKIFYQQN